MSQTHERLLSLKPLFKHLISKESPSDFIAELRNYVVDSDLPQLQNSDRLNAWWSKLYETKQYQMLSRKFVSMVNNFIDSRSGRTAIDTCSAIMTVKY